MELAITITLLIKLAILLGAVILTAVISFIGIPVAIFYLILATLHYWQNGSEVFTGQDILILTILTILAVFLDNIVLMIGLKKGDASRKAYIGSILGAMAGMLTANLTSLIALTAAGAIIGELLHGKPAQQSVKNGLHAAAGLLLGSMMRAILSMSIAVYVLKNLLI